MNKPNNEYEMLFGQCYELIQSALRCYVQSGNRVLDLGINNGNLEMHLEAEAIDCKVIGVDTDAEALAKIASLDLFLVDVKIVCADANEFVTGFTGEIDNVILSATLHEINDYENQAEYLRWFFGRMAEVLPSGGNVIVGDFYFPNDVTDEQYRSFKAFQLQAIAHADAREKFVNPELLTDIACECGFHVAKYDEIRAVKELNRRYYTVVFEKK